MSGWRAALVAAVVGGVVLLVGFFVARNPEPNGTTTTSLPEAGVEVRLVCAPALETVCQTLATGFGGTASELRAGSTPPEDAVVIAPLTDVPAGLTLGSVIGRTPVVIALWSERSGVLSRHCGGKIDAACLAGAYGQTWAELGGDDSWGEFKIGLADPSAGAGELAAWQAVGTDLANLPVSLRVKSRNDADLVGQLGLFGPARMDVVISTEVSLAAQLENVQDQGRLELFYPDPGPWVEFVAAWSGGSGEKVQQSLLTPEAQAALAAAGLRPASGETAGLPAELGTPGQALPAIDDQTRSTLLVAWAALGA
jgi:hypothetical protein